jgi:hypothetical protein
MFEPRGSNPEQHEHWIGDAMLAEGIGTVSLSFG